MYKLRKKGDEPILDALESKDKKAIEKFVKEKGVECLNGVYKEDRYHDHQKTPILFFVPHDVEFLKWLDSKYGEKLKWNCFFSHRHEGGGKETPLAFHYVNKVDTKKESGLNFLKYLFKIEGVNVSAYSTFYADWMRYAGANEKRHIIEAVITKNDVKLAKFLVEELNINYFNFNEFNLVNHFVRKHDPAVYQKALDHYNDARRYIHSKRNLWNPKHFKYFSVEYQKNVLSFLWAMKEVGTHFPKELVYTVYQFVDFCAFEYIYGKIKKNKANEEVYVWEKCPKFLENEKQYHFQLQKIKKKCGEIFGIEKYDVEFKCIIDKLVYDKLDLNYKKSCMINHWPLITLVHQLKNKIFESSIKEVVDLLRASVKELYGEKYVQRSEIAYRYDNKQMFNWLDDKINRNTGYCLKEYKLKKREETFEQDFRNVLEEFVKFVRELR